MRYELACNKDVIKVNAQLVLQNPKCGNNYINFYEFILIFLKK